LPEQQYDIYGNPVVDVASLVRQQVQEAWTPIRQELDAFRGAERLKQFHAGKSPEHPWYGPQEQQAVEAAMTHTGIMEPELIFRAMFIDRIVDEAVARANKGRPTVPVVPADASEELPPSIPTGRRQPAAGKESKAVDTSGTPEEFAARLQKQGLIG
jgi:hypothetical protein